MSRGVVLIGAGHWQVRGFASWGMSRFSAWTGWVDRIRWIDLNFVKVPSEGRRRMRGLFHGPTRLGWIGCVESDGFG